MQFQPSAYFYKVLVCFYASKEILKIEQCMQINRCALHMLRCAVAAIHVIAKILLFGAIRIAYRQRNNIERRSKQSATVRNYMLKAAIQPVDD